MRASILLQCILLVSSALLLSARPISSAPVNTNAGQLTSSAQVGQHDDAPSNAREHQHYHYGQQARVRHEASERPVHDAPRDDDEADETSVHDVSRARAHAARAVDASGLRMRLEARHKKKEAKKPAAPAKPKPAKKKHHVNWKKVGSTVATVAGDVGKFLLKFLRREEKEEEALLLLRGEPEFD